VLHPLPRVGELDVSLDTDSRALYFRQAAYGVPIRMALIDLLAGADTNDRLAPREGGFEDPRWPLYDRPLDTGMRCTNPNCIVHDPLEQPHVRNKFWVVRSGRADAAKIRCFYCESDVTGFVVGRARKLEAVGNATFDDLAADIARVVFFRNADDARKDGFHDAAPKRRRA
jgi:hypothetical protein